MTMTPHRSLRSAFAQLRFLWTAFVLFLALPGAALAQADPNQGPGGPILVVTSSTATFSKYYAEILRAEGLTKVYRTGDVEVHALRGVDLALAPRELIVLLGPSGSGKSTLLNILGGLDTPSAGHVWFHDRELTARDEAGLTAYRRLHVGFVFQFYNLIPSLTARENVALVTDIADDPMPPEDALAMVGLAERVDHFPAQLSGGEQQRVAIARAIAKRPDVLLCDEPTGALDVETGRLVLHTIDHVNRETGSSTVLMAQAYPNSTIVGIDYHAPSIEAAKAKAAEAGVSNVEFQLARAQDFAGVGFDFVCIFDALHDMGAPVGAARHIRGKLASGGTFMLVEPMAGDTMAENMHPLGQIFYAASCTICTRLRRSCVFPETSLPAARVCSSRASSHSKRRWRSHSASRASVFVIFVVLDWFVAQLAARGAALAIGTSIAIRAWIRTGPV